MSVRRCRVCGCTQNQACEGGCWWVAADLCSSCRPEKPILFSGLMVQRILEGRKTQTRRVVKPQPAGGLRPSVFVPSGVEDLHGREVRSPFGLPGHRLWVRETWGPCDGDVCYRADEPEGSKAKPDDGRWHPSIHMPRWACRLVLDITEVRVERLLDISDADCMAEGVRPTVDGTATDWRHDETGARRTFRQLWQSINGPASWDANPWVWAITFKKVSG